MCPWAFHSHSAKERWVHPASFLPRQETKFSLEAEKKRGLEWKRRASLLEDFVCLIGWLACPLGKNICKCHRVGSWAIDVECCLPEVILLRCYFLGRPSMLHLHLSSSPLMNPSFYQQPMVSKPIMSKRYHLCPHLYQKTIQLRATITAQKSTLGHSNSSKGHRDPRRATLKFAGSSRTLIPHRRYFFNAAKSGSFSLRPFPDVPHVQASFETTKLPRKGGYWLSLGFCFKRQLPSFPTEPQKLGPPQQSTSKLSDRNPKWSKIPNPP